ncbi:STE3-domain-containing protein [Serendipita vermifera]|nr:STE3-domain-containing protein [Serendipita vermifera]
MAITDMSYLYPAYPIICFFTMLLVLFPVPAHWKAGNIATISLALWTFFGLLMCMVNTIVWHGNIRHPHPVWGDICQAYFAIMPVGIAGSTFCVQYRLWSIARSKMVFITKQEKRRQKYSTYFLCLGLPLLVCLLHYVVQGHRQNVVEDLGPTAQTYNVTLAFAIYYIWEPGICLISAIFSVMTIRLFLAQRKEFDAVLASGSTNINKDRYFRLLWLAATAVVIHLPLASWALIVNATAFTVHPWISWEDTHSNYMRISYFTRFLLSQNRQNVTFYSISYWAVVLCGVNFFIFFGFGEEASKQYKVILGAILRPFGIKYPKEKKRKTIKKTWLDVLLRRPGKPINLTSSIVTSTTPQFASNVTSSRPEPSSNNNRRVPQTRTQTTSGGNDLNIDISHLDFLDPVEAKKQARIAAYSRPGQAAKKAKAALAGRPASVCSSVHRDSFDGPEEDQPQPSTSNKVEDEKAMEALSTDITDQHRQSKAVDSDAATTTTQEKVDEKELDLEAQREADEAALAQERRRAILEKNPELTEEITF